MANTLAGHAVPIRVPLESALLDFELVRSVVWAEEAQQDVDSVVDGEHHEVLAREVHARLPVLAGLKEGETHVVLGDVLLASHLPDPYQAHKGLEGTIILVTLVDGTLGGGPPRALNSGDFADCSYSRRFSQIS